MVSFRIPKLTHWRLHRWEGGGPRFIHGPKTARGLRLGDGRKRPSGDLRNGPGFDAEAAPLMESGSHGMEAGRSRSHAHGGRATGCRGPGLHSSFGRGKSSKGRVGSVAIVLIAPPREPLASRRSGSTGQTAGHDATRVKKKLHQAVRREIAANAHFRDRPVDLIHRGKPPPLKECHSPPRMLQPKV